MTFISIFGTLFLLGMVSVVIVVIIVLVSNATRDKQGPRDFPTQEPIDRPRQENQYHTPVLRERTSQNTVIGFVVLFLVIIIGGIYFSVQISQLKSDVTNLNNQLSGLNQSLWQTQSRVSSLSSQLEELERQDDYVDRVTYDLASITEDGQGLVDVTIYMNQMPLLEEVTLVIEDEGENVETVLLTSESLIIHTTVTLDLTKTYDFYLVTEETERLVSQHILKLRMDSMMYGLKGVTMEEEYDENEFIFNFTVYNNYSLNESLAFKEVWVELYDGETLTSTILYTVADQDINQRQEYYLTYSFDPREQDLFFVKIIGINHFNNEYVLFHEGW